MALVWGDLRDDEGTIVGKIGRNVRNRQIMDVFPTDSPIGKHAVTHYRVLERFGYVTLIECRLETGRTHQIRIHMKFIGHPLFNDPEYGGRDASTSGSKPTQEPKPKLVNQSIWMNRIIAIAALIWGATPLAAQEYLSMPVVPVRHQTVRQQAVSTTTLQLPFIDDFSYDQAEPDQRCVIIASR